MHLEKCPRACGRSLSQHMAMPSSGGAQLYVNPVIRNNTQLAHALQTKQNKHIFEVLLQFFLFVFSAKSYWLTVCLHLAA